MSITLQKANFWKRISAYLFDFILTVILALGIAFGVSAIVKYNSCLDDYNAKQNFYYVQAEEKYGIEVNLTQENYDAMTEEERAEYDKTYELALSEINQNMNADKEAVALMSKVFNLTLVSLSISLLFSIFTVHFLVPLFLKNGQTLGKKIFGLGVMRTNFVKISNPILFIRSIVGLYAMETMFPLLMLLMTFFNLLGGIGLLMILLLFILQIGVMITTKTNSSIHDLLSDCVVVDFASQQIFETEEALIAYKQEQHEKQVNTTRA